ncbi:MAG: M56 family metallopeptidase, partial [Acidobacteria bacterium]|nr:M56 family metallopeptidase [Acidobacteriota bacterium]
MTEAEILHRGASSLGTLAAEHLWQATVFGCLILCLASALRRAPARLRHNLYLLSPLKFLLPVALLLPLAGRWSKALSPWIPPQFLAVFDLRQGLGAGFRLLGLDPGEAGPAALPSPLWFWTLAIWVVGAVLLALLCYRRWNRFRSQLLQGREETSGRLAERLELQRRRLGLKAPVRLLLSSSVLEPGVWGVRQATLLLPEGVAETLQDDELDAVLLHELVHVQRRDNLVGWTLLLLRCLFWFHPLVWW